jgi:hypothetical protein
LSELGTVYRYERSGVIAGLGSLLGALAGLGDGRLDNPGAAPLLDQGQLEELRDLVSEPPPDGGLWTGRNWNLAPASATRTRSPTTSRVSGVGWLVVGDRLSSVEPLSPSGSLGTVVAIPVKLGYTVVGEACDEPTTAAT